MRKSSGLVVVASLLAASLATATAAAAAAGQAEPAAASTVTECDRLASHPEDPQRVAPGVEREQIDLPIATAACERALVALPGNARQRYQYARLLFYAGRNDRAVAEMQRAADEGYAQAQFVFGTFVTRHRPGAPTDICVAERYWRQSAAGGRQAARIQYLRYATKGRFDGCAGTLDAAQRRELLGVATAAAHDFYERLVIEDLTDALAARPDRERT